MSIKRNQLLRKISNNAGLSAMRIFLLLIAAFGLSYISYYLFLYRGQDNEQAFEQPMVQPTDERVAEQVEDDSNTLSAPTVDQQPAAQVAAEPPSAATTEPQPAAANRTTLWLKKINEGPDEEIAAAILFLLTEASEEERQALEPALRKRTANQLATQLEPFTNEANYPPAVIAKTLEMALAEGSLEASRLVISKLQTDDVNVRSVAAEAISSADRQALNTNVALPIFNNLLDLFQAGDPPQDKLFTAMYDLSEKLEQEEKQILLDAGINAMQRTENNGGDQVLLEKIKALVESDDALLESLKEQLANIEPGAAGVAALNAIIEAENAPETEEPQEDEEEDLSVEP